LATTLLVLPQLAGGWRRRSAALLAVLAVTGLVIAVGVATRLLDFQAFAV
jgi:hypothetical protein